MRRERLPVDVRTLALNAASRWSPEEPLVRVEEAEIPGVEGALLPLRGGGRWAIAYRRAGRSAGRVNFTVAHELGHYLMHRDLLPRGVSCPEGDIVTGSARSTAIEQEANSFATALLMPLSDFKGQLPPGCEPSRDGLSVCADLFAVSVTAALLRWVGYTERTAMVVMSRDGFILWARSSPAALRRQLFLAAARAVIELPTESPAFGGTSSPDAPTWMHSKWFGMPARELTFRSERHGQVASVVLFADS